MLYTTNDNHQGDTTTGSQAEATPQQTQNEPREPSAKAAGKKPVQDSSDSQLQKRGQTSGKSDWDPQRESSKGQRHNAGQDSHLWEERRGRSRLTNDDQVQADREERERRIREKEQRESEQRRILEGASEDEKDRYHYDDFVEGVE